MHRIEPYVYAQMIAGKEASRHGEAKNSWLTGTASWNFVTVSQYLLGVRPDYDGLVVDPCIGEEVGEYTVRRQIPRRDVRDHREEHGAKGAKLTRRRRGHRGQPVPYAPAGSVVRVEAVA